jgi:uncharacterized protein (DUF3084 family)
MSSTPPPQLFTDDITLVLPAQEKTEIELLREKVAEIELERIQTRVEMEKFRAEMLAMRKSLKKFTEVFTAGCL